MKRGMVLPTAAALLISLVLMASAGLAQTEIIPVSGIDAVTFIDPGDRWTDDDGVTHIRGLTMSSVLTGVDIDGVPVSGTGAYEANMNANYATGEGDLTVWGSLVANYGDLAGSWRIRFSATGSGFVWHGEFIGSRGYDDFAGWHIRGTWTGVFGAAVPNVFEGVFQIPGGKAVTTEATTWSAVKDLYR